MQSPKDYLVVAKFLLSLHFRCVISSTGKQAESFIRLKTGIFGYYHVSWLDMLHIEANNFKNV